MNVRLWRRWTALILFEAGIKSLQLKDYDVVERTFNCL
jgi:hypothetical protein